MSNKPTASDLIKLTAIAWASGEYTENELINKLSIDYDITDEKEIDLILKGCVELQAGLTNSLKQLSGRSNFVSNDSLLN